MNFIYSPWDSKDPKSMSCETIPTKWIPDTLLNEVLNAFFNVVSSYDLNLLPFDFFSKSSRKYTIITWKRTIYLKSH